MATAGFVLGIIAVIGLVVVEILTVTGNSPYPSLT